MLTGRPLVLVEQFELEGAKKLSTTGFVERVTHPSPPTTPLGDQPSLGALPAPDMNGSDTGNKNLHGQQDDRRGYGAVGTSEPVARCVDPQIPVDKSMLPHPPGVRVRQGELNAGLTTRPPGPLVLDGINGPVV